MKASDIERLVFSPFHTSKILHHFLSGAKSVNSKCIKTELVYLLLPFIYNNQIQSKLKNLKTNSKFNAFIVNTDFDVFVSSLNQRMNDYRKTTNTAIILLANEIDLEIDKYLVASTEIHFNDEKDIYLRPIYKSSYNLGIILGKEQYLSVFKKLRITEL
ncbi:three component ABC system middle component [Polaribacter sp. 20A6]|uniref:three component ABC system middle component n=1 Tax=Polaribacter sp. 20A6 TaxID=2687289 RepID=UPI0013FD2B9D|nr:three component ABC system middle component [Polaribacter sp. 20A6]